VRSFMEPRFGSDFSKVRVHTGSEAVQMNRDLNAQAFTHQQDVYFGAGKAPGNNALTAHELTHVVQQAAQPMLQRDEDAAQSKVVDFGYNLELPSIELKDKDGVPINTLSTSLDLFLKTKPPLTAKAGNFKFSFGKLKLTNTFKAALTSDGSARPNISTSIGAGASLTIAEATLNLNDTFLPRGSEVKALGKWEGTVDVLGGQLDSKIKPSIKITIPLTKETYLKAEADASQGRVGIEGKF
jgi:hypothetical protein